MSRSPLSRYALIALAAALTATGIAGPANAEPDTGTIGGRFTDRGGAGLHGYTVQLQQEGGPWIMTSTDGSGNFSANVPPGRYRVMFHRFDFTPGVAPFIQYVPQTDVTNEATVFNVAAGQTVTVDEMIYRGGTVTGRFTDAAGNPLVGVGVTPSRPELPMYVFAYTDSDGRFRFDRLRAHSGWHIQFIGQSQGYQQYAFGQTHVENAAAISVVDGQTTVVNDSKLPTGSIKVTARDAVTGAAVPRFQANLGVAGGYADGEDGTATIDGVAIGAHKLDIWAYGYEFLEGHPVTVQTGQQTTVTVSLRPKTRIDATVIDAATGQPLEGMCLIVVKPMQFRLPDWCEGASSAGGKAIAEVDEPGWYQVFAFPTDAPGYGAQWVGANGGTGRQLQARLIKVEAGKAAAAPVVKVDRAGTITGRVLAPNGEPVVFADRPGTITRRVPSTKGAPVVKADRPGTITGRVPGTNDASVEGFVSVGDWSTFVGPSFGMVEVDEEGRYEIGFLGPYRWPLRFHTFQHAWQYTGGVGNRHLARTVPVTAGQTTTLDYRLAAGASLVADINGISGYCYLLAYNAATQESIGESYVEDCSQPVTVPLVGPQQVKLQVLDENGFRNWSGGPVPIPSSGTVHVTLNF